MEGLRLVHAARARVALESNTSHRLICVENRRATRARQADARGVRVKWGETRDARCARRCVRVFSVGLRAPRRVALRHARARGRGRNRQVDRRPSPTTHCRRQRAPVQANGRHPRIGSYNANGKRFTVLIRVSRVPLADFGQPTNLLRRPLRATKRRARSGRHEWCFPTSTVHQQ